MNQKSNPAISCKGKTRGPGLARGTNQTKPSFRDTTSTHEQNKKMKHRLFKPKALLGNANHNYIQEFNNHFQLKTSALGWMINACLLWSGCTGGNQAAAPSLCCSSVCWGSRRTCNTSRLSPCARFSIRTSAKVVAAELEQNDPSSAFQLYRCCSPHLK